MEDDKDGVLQHCMFCLGETSRYETFWKDISSTAVCQWVKELYAMEIIPPDRIKSVCRKCFIVILNDYEAFTVRQLATLDPQKKQY